MTFLQMIHGTMGVPIFFNNIAKNNRSLRQTEDKQNLLEEIQSDSE